MKRIILLLLVLICFQNSYGEELSAEKQQLAWKFIYENMLSKEYLPTIFKEDITINLKGEITSEDSIVVKDLIKSFQKAIPQLKIELSNVPGNLILGLNDGKNNRVTTNVSTEQGISSHEIFLPVDLTQAKRKQYIYYHLFRGLIFYGNNQKDVPDMKGCVYAEKYFQSITYSPLDLFILKKLYAPDFSIQLAENLPTKLQETAWNNTLLYNYQLRTGGMVAGILFSILLFSILVRKGIFKFHDWKIKRFISQTLWIVAIIDLYIITYSAIKNLNLLYIIHERNSFQSFVFINLTFSIIPLLFFLIERKLNNTNINIKDKLMYLILNSLIISFTLTLAYLIVYYRNEISYKVTFSFGISFVVASIRFLLFTLSELKRNELKEKDLELTLLREKNKQAELQSLRAKINPHFLYNALNSIASLATTDGRKTEQMALSLSDFFKYSINREQKQLNTLSEELNAIRTYLEIEKVRFGDRLSFEIDCPTELLDIQIPQLLIQPLVENAIKHGLSQITQNGLIRISVSKIGSQLKIRVYDNGPAFPEGPLTGFGIQNTQERIGLLYGPKATINWQNGKEKFIEISLPL